MPTLHHTRGYPPHTLRPPDR